jgi:hypothetical protein
MRRLLGTVALLLMFFVGPVLNLDVEHLSPAQLCFARVGWAPRPCITSLTRNKIQLAGSKHVREGPTLFRNSRSRLRNHDLKMQTKGSRSADLELEESATRYALARQQELAMQIRKDLMLLEDEALKTIESATWNAFLLNVAVESDDEVAEGGTPWEPDEQDVEECGLFYDEVNNRFHSFTCGPFVRLCMRTFAQIFVPSLLLVPGFGRVDPKQGSYSDDRKACGLDRFIPQRSSQRIRCKGIHPLTHTF